MEFLRGASRRATTGALPGLGSVLLLATVGFAAIAVPSRAEEPVLHHVTYTVTAQNPFYADISYRDTEPPNFADYSHNPYQFSPKVEADVGPGKPWVLDVMLADPGQWAMVAATSGLSPTTPMFIANSRSMVSSSIRTAVQRMRSARCVSGDLGVATNPAGRTIG